MFSLPCSIQMYLFCVHAVPHAFPSNWNAQSSESWIFTLRFAFALLPSCLMTYPWGALQPLEGLTQIHFSLAWNLSLCVMSPLSPQPERQPLRPGALSLSSGGSHSWNISRRMSENDHLISSLHTDTKSCPM